jgi:hypothetical protein
MTRKIHPCSHPGCLAFGATRVEDGWLCTPHILECILSLGNSTQADLDLETFREGGGKPS